MYRVLSCLTEQHDYRLVLLAVLICAVTTFTAFQVYSSAGKAKA
jgi:NO-binding membrane sensor protein with MHYT domain